MARRTHHFVANLSVAFAVVLAWAIALPAAAQQQAGGDGRALDASPQVGSGGVNAPADRIDFRARNDLITGNVGGGRAFRDTVDYVATGEFRDVLGSDDLFRFRADTLPSGLDRLNAVEASRQYAIGAGTSVFRLHSQPPTPPDRLAPERLDDVSVGGYWDMPRPGEVDRTPVEDWLADPMEFGLEARGRALEGRAAVSPLLGLRGPESETWLPIDDEEPTVDPPADVDALRDPLAEPEARLETRLPGLVLGHYLLGPSPADAADPTDAERWAAFDRWGEQWLEQRWAARADEAFAPGVDPYSDMLAALRDDERQDDRLEADDTGAPVLELEEPTRRDIERAEQRRRETRERVGLALDPERRDASEALEALLDRLDYRLPRLQSLAGERDDRVSAMMREAEQQLTAGEFIDAERLYRRVLAHARDEPLARVGLVHAQLGAGMYRSAGMHLRHLLEQYPELAAARYGADLLPDAERIQSARNQLERNIEREDRTAGSSALLLAYIGRQAEVEALVQLGLAHAEALHPNDPLLPMLRRLWLGEAEEDEGAQEQ